VLLTTDAKCTRSDLLAHAKARGVSELAVPAEILVVPAIPLLGSGKPDYVAVLALAKEKAGGATNPATA
jgi:acyl-[acyl-carrier-protein]-phospholipid O-acyltransferase/long-chain-fatty-acid--[acyl-carrier-protein] ligase